MLTGIYSARHSFLLDLEAMNLEASLCSWGKRGKQKSRTETLKVNCRETAKTDYSRKGTTLFIINNISIFTICDTLVIKTALHIVTNIFIVLAHLSLHTA